MIKTENFARLEITNSTQLRAWLAAHHAQSDSIWLVTFKAHIPAKYVSREQVLDEILCFGWIDGIRRKLDADRTMQLLSPRRQQAWAQTYKDRAARLIADGRMQPPGLAAIATSKSLGLWDASAEVDALIIPPDLAAALARCHATAQFAAFAPSYRRNVLRWLSTAKTQPTRDKRADIIAAHAAQGRKVPQY